MKKVLLASTALIGFAGMAAAEVTLSGSGRFGIVYTDDGTTATPSCPTACASTSTPRPRLTRA